MNIIEACGAVMGFCWRILDKPIILDTYSLFNVFQGLFAAWVFRIVVMDGMFSFNTSKGSKFRYSNRKSKEPHNKYYSFTNLD